MKNSDVAQKAGEIFGTQIARLVGKATIRTVTVKSVDEDFAYVYIYDNDEALPVPLSMLSIPNACLKITPTVGTLAVIGFLNGDENTPYFIAYQQIDSVSFSRSKTSVVWSIDPEDDTKDEISLAVGESSINVTSDLISFNGGENNGLVLHDPLKADLIKINDLLNAIVGVISGAPIPEPGMDAPSALQTSLKTAISGKILSTYDDIQNEKIKQ